MKNYVGVLLAAGSSTRFKTNKLLHILPNGKTILEQSAQTLIKLCPDSIAIVNDNSAINDTLSDLGFRVFVNQFAEKGLGSSIACAVSHSANANGWLLCLADMPFIKPHTFNLVLKNIANNKMIIAPTYKQQRGHPVYVSHHFYHELIHLDQDYGARYIIKNNRDDLILIDVDDSGILKDIDKPDDLNGLHSIKQF